MMRSKLRTVCLSLLGALLLGFLWRVRGTHGWGSSWGLLNAGFVFSLFLSLAVGKRKAADLPLTVLGALSFMLTCPAWGTLLEQITGVLSVSARDGDPVLYEINPASGVMMMLALGFGLASIWGVMLGRTFGEKRWRFQDYAAVVFSFIASDLLAKATVGHWLLRLIEPQAVTAFENGLAAAGTPGKAYSVYMSHFMGVSWAKGIVGGRNYFQSVAMLSLAVAAVCVFLTVRLVVKDSYAAKTGLVVSAAFSCSITLSDLWFFFGAGGYRMAQGFSLPAGFAPWSLWEYCTGFFAGGVITAFLCITARKKGDTPPLLPETAGKKGRLFGYVLVTVGGVGINTVRPLLEKAEPQAASVVSAAVMGLAVLAAAVLGYRRLPYPLDQRSAKRLTAILGGGMTVFILLVYLFVGESAFRDLHSLHNILALLSAIMAATYFARRAIFEVRS